MLPCVCLFSDRSQMTLKCGKIKEVAHESQASVSLMFLPQRDYKGDREGIPHIHPIP